MATSTQKILRDTPIVFQDSSGDVAITLANLAADGARVSARYDLGAGATPGDFQFRATFRSETTPVFNESFDLYIAESDGTLEDGDVGTADAAVLTPVLPDLHYIGSVVVQIETADTDHRASGVFRVASRYYSLVVHNNTADGLKNTANVNTITVTAIPPQMQAT